MRRSLSLLLAALALTSLVTACGGSDETNSSGPPVSTLTVKVKDSVYEPADVSISAGQTVTWYWEGGSLGHDVKSTSSSEKYGSKVQTSGTFSHTFNRPGRFAYFCSLHPQMRGTVRVS
jgi:plastocyanin